MNRVYIASYDVLSVATSYMYILEQCQAYDLANASCIQLKLFY